VDDAGNQGNTSFYWTYDTTKPTMVITSDDSNNDDEMSLNLIFTISENTESFEASDVTVSGGYLESFSGFGNRYTATLRATETIVSVLVNTDRFTDYAGNANDAVDSFDLIFDTTHPTVSITATEGASPFTSNHNVLNLKFSISEDTTDFEQSDVTLSGGTLSSFQGQDRTYMAQFTPNSDEATTTIQITYNKFHDAAGNGNYESNVFEWTPDYTSPSIQIKSPQGVSGFTSNDDTLSLEFVTSEHLHSFGAHDIKVGGGIITSFEMSHFEKVSSTTWGQFCDGTGTVMSSLTTEEACRNGCTASNDCDAFTFITNLNCASNRCEFLSSDCSVILTTGCTYYLCVCVSLSLSLFHTYAYSHQK